MLASGGHSAAASSRTGASSKRAAPTVDIGSAVQIRNTAAVTGAGREAELGRQALAAVRVNWQQLYPGWTIAFLPAQPALLGMTLVRERRVEIYVRTDRPLGGLVHDIAHELGHVTDVMYNSDADRARFLSLRRLSPTTPWWTCSGCRDLDVPAGDFAETFALYAAPRFRFYSDAAPEPSAADLRSFAEQVLPLEFRAAVGASRADATTDTTAISTAPTTVAPPTTVPTTLAPTASLPTAG